MNLDGCSMVEFRRDARGRPVLMEVNARMPGSIALSHAAGIDFPKLIYDWALGRPLEKVAGYQIGRRLRWLGGDAWNLKCAFERDGHPDSPDPWGAVGTFLFDFVRRPSPLDIFDLSDMAPAFVDLRQMVMKPGLDKLRSLAFRDRGNVDSGAGSHKKSVRRQRRDER
jgi:predicted ATP-grasp superfamily ATP-dependent carboligase